MVMRMLGGLAGILLAWSLWASAQEKISGSLESLLSTAREDENLLVWVTFTDKGPRQQKASLELISPRALERRSRVLPPDQLVGEADLAVDETYLARLAATGAVLHERSRWLNAASVSASGSAIRAIAALPFVRSIEPVARFSRNPATETTSPPPPGRPPKISKSEALDYGASLPQVSLLNIPAVQAKGNYAQGVLIGVFDNGFRLLNHEALDSLKILATYDFVDKKVSVIPNNPNPSFGGHGVETLSTLAGYRPGQLLGPAFGATFILARTENDSSETPLEEDNWVAAIEWAESLGVQVTSTSLGYLTYDAPYMSWTWEDMNGRTTKITQAAAMAVRRGVIVVNSAGNNGIASDTARNTLNAPADADSVLAVGAVSPAGLRAGFSSVGPTTSVPPHIKPDVMATGMSVYCASPSNVNGYVSSQGTSFSCPLAAGVAALVLHSHPEATPMQVVEAIKMTASRGATPDNRYGWGIINASAAINYLSGPGPIPLTTTLDQNYPNPFNPRTTILFRVPEDGRVTLTIYDLLGRRVRTLLSGILPKGTYFPQWGGEDDNGKRLSSGVYFYRLEATGLSGNSSVITKKMMLVR